MCSREGKRLRRGMYYRLKKNYSVILMNTSSDAPYEDFWEEAGKILIYEGHNAFRRKGCPDPKSIDQPYTTKSRKLTQNGLFFEAVKAFKLGKRKAERVKVYEKIAPGIWKYHGFFRLVDAWRIRKDGRYVFKFRLLAEKEL
ncbi:MAG: YDG/SRA domain-containing protein [Candidatus Hadarchaeales archaeon]